MFIKIVSRTIIMCWTILICLDLININSVLETLINLVIVCFFVCGFDRIVFNKEWNKN